MPTPDGFRVTQHPPGSEPIDLTRAITSANWSSSVPGGFGDATISIPRILTQKERGLLGSLTIEYEGRVLFDGRIEDAKFSLSKTGMSTDLQAFGYQRLLTDNSIRRIWSLRSSLNPTASTSARGSSSTGALVLSTQAAQYTTGRFDSANPTRYGIAMTTGATMVENECLQIGIALPAGLTGAKLLFDRDAVLGGLFGKILVHSSADGVTYTRHLESGSPTTTLVPGISLVNGATDIRISVAGVGGNNGGGDILRLFDIRVLGTALNEDVLGGFYGGTILRDVVATVPGLYPGTIEDGSDLVLGEFARVNRTTCLDVVQQIDPLYAREWGVWEGGRFDWITPDLKSGGWVVPLGAASALEIEQSIDSLHKRTYVTFQDAADQQFKEAFSDSGQARNPYVRTGANKDGIYAAAAMTSLTAPLLAAKLNNDFGRWPDIKGSVTILAGQQIKAANSARSIPAYALRAGDNITIPELPIEDIYAAGQDGQTVFHVTGVQSGIDGNVVLTLEGLTRRADVLLARLGAISQ